MSLQNSTPTNVDSPSEDATLLGRVVAKAQRHVEQWGRRYVEMRVDALKK